METKRLTRIAVQATDSGTSDYGTGCVRRRGDNLQQRGRPRACPQQLG